MIKHSFCTTSYNTGDQLEDFLCSILPNIDIDDELICVDNLSDKTTSDIYKKYLELFHDKNFKVYKYRCNRGLGRDLAYHKSIGEYIITLDSDVQYFPIYWDILKKIDESPYKKDNVFYMCYSFFINRELLDYIGGFPHINSTEDMYIYNIFFKRKKLFWIPLMIGGSQVHRCEEKRYTSNPFKQIIRIFLNYRDNFRVDETFDIKNKIKHIKSFCNSRIKYYFFWIPLIIFLSPYRINKKNIVDLTPDKNHILTFGYKQIRYKKVFDLETIGVK